MAFLPKFADRTGYNDANIYEFERRREEPYRETSSVSWGPSPLQQGGYGNRGMFGPALRSRGMVDQVGQSGGNPTAGLLGIQNTTGFSQEAPNVVYDQGPEQFEKQLKLQKENLGIERLKAEGILEQNRIYNQIRQQNADTAAGRNDIAMYKAMHPNAIFKETPGGIVAIDPQTNEVTQLGVSGLKMAEADRLGKQFGYNWSLGEQRGQQAMELAGVNNAADAAIAQAIQQAIGARQGAEHEFQRGNTIYKTEAGIYKNKFNQDPNDTARRIFNTRPDLAPFIQFDDKGNAVINAPGKMNETWGGFGPTVADPSSPSAAQHAEMLKLIYGDAAAPPQYPPLNRPAFNSTPGGNVGTVLPGTGESSSPNTMQLRPEQMQGFQAAPGQYNAQPGQFTSQAGQAAAAQGKKVVKMIAPDGGELEVPEDQVDAMKAKGARIANAPAGQTGALGAGQTGRPAAGTLTGPSAGTVGR